MEIITQQQVRALGVSAATCVELVKESFSLKKRAQLPAKISVHPQGYDFYTAMPCLLPEEYNRVGLKMVHRVNGAVPSLGSDILIYEASTGELLALMDCDWITTMRTGAVATLAAQTFRKEGDVTYCFVGLGNTARATLLCLLESERTQMHKVLLYRYKNQAALFMERFKAYDNVTFEVVDDISTMFSMADVIYSCITDANGLFCEDESKFRPGCTLIPVHVRGFQNCDLFFDKIYGDDTEPLRSWQNFANYRYYAEIQDVIDGTAEGRSNNDERILSYNYGLALHDIVFASKLYEMLKGRGTQVCYPKETDKFWI